MNIDQKSIESKIDELFSELDGLGKYEQEIIYMRDFFKEVNDNSYSISVSYRANNKSRLNSEKISSACFIYDIDENDINIGLVSIISSYQNQGYGRKLYESIEQFAREFDCSKIKFDINLAPGFWKKMGYRKNGEYWEKQL